MDYTLRHQVIETYDFTSSITVAIKEYCPDLIIFTRLQIFRCSCRSGSNEEQMDWMNLKKDFIDLQATDPFILSMGLKEQRVII